jgi:hypothetical protein
LPFLAPGDAARRIGGDWAGNSSTCVAGLIDHADMARLMDSWRGKAAAGVVRRLRAAAPPLNAWWEAALHCQDQVNLAAVRSGDYLHQASTRHHHW